MKKYNYVVLGAGRQGTAAAYDLAIHGNAKAITLSDISELALKKSIKLLTSKTKNVKFSGVNSFPGRETLSGVDACVNAFPYSLGVDVAKLAIQCKVSVCDLGCDTAIVKEQTKLNNKAKKAKVSIVPDCGLAPGNSTMFAMHVYNRLKEMKVKIESIRVYCGGLPEPSAAKNLPLQYKIVFSPIGLLNNYQAKSWVLCDGNIKQTEPLGNLENIVWNDMQLEAFDSYGGASLLPWKFQKKGIPNFSYKTLRYPGHIADIKNLDKLGMMNLKDPTVKKAWSTIIAKNMEHPKVKDIVLLIGVGTGINKSGRRVRVTIDMLDTHDGVFSAMERTTGFAAGIVAHQLAKKKFKYGVHTPDEVMSSCDYISEMNQRGFYLTEMIEKPC